MPKPTPAAPTSSKLQLNDDGTVTVPIRRDGQATAVVLQEPTMRELATIHDLATTADDALPKMPALGDDAKADDIAEYQRIGRERQAITRSVESPYGQALMKIVGMLSDETVTEDQLFGWATSPVTLRKIIDHFSSPLGG